VVLPIYSNPGGSIRSQHSAVKGFLMITLHIKVKIPTLFKRTEEHIVPLERIFGKNTFEYIITIPKI
jgi:hypothetical protein